TNSEATSMNKDMGAKAFTSKNDIFFNEGNFSPQSKEGQTLLAHELTHTIQQGASNPLTQEENGQETNNLAPTSEGNNDAATASSETPVEEVGSEGGDLAVEENGEIAAEGSENAEGANVPGEAAEENIATTPRSPEDDPNFQQLENRVETTSEDQSNHEEPQAVAGAAQGAAVSPANERDSMAQAGQVDEMDNAEAGEITAESFKAQLMERIESMQLPATQEEAADFDNNNNIDEVNEAATQDVQNEQTAAAGPIEQTSQQEPNVDAVPEREITPLAEAPIGTAPPSVNPDRAMPPERGDAEVSQPLQDNMAEVDGAMAENEVTDEQLANSNEPTFVAGLDAKGQAKENTENAPNALRQQEQGILQNAQINANTTGSAGLETMHQDRSAALNQVNENQQQTGTTDTVERTRIAGEINTIYESAKTDVETLLSDLDTRVATIFTAGTKAAKSQFESYVERKMDAYKDRRYSGARGALRWVGDKFSGLPDEVNEFFVEGREVYINYMDGVITEVAQLVADKLNEAKTRIATGKQEVQDYVTSLPENLQQIGQDAAEEISTKFDELEESVNSKQEELIDNLAQAYTDGLEAVDARIEEMKAANRGLIDMALGAIMGIIETIINIKNMLTDLLMGALDAIGAIISDPIGFLSNLFSGVAQGFQNFGSNILTHLQTALIQWLTGTLGPVGITIPDDLFSLKGIFSLVAQILGLTWDFIRRKAVKLLGEPAVQALELGFEIFQILKTGGIDGLWEYLKEQFNDLKETVIGAIKEMVITTVVEAGIKWIIGLMNPASAFVKACMMIIDVVRFFIERGSQIIELVKAFTEGVKAVATGNVTAVANAIENALARALPVVIGFLASLLGIGGLARKVQKIIGKIRKRIDKAVDKIIKKAKSAFKKLLKKGKAKVKGAAAAVLQWWKKKKNFTTSDGKKHKLYFKGSNNKSKVTVESDPQTLENILLTKKWKIESGKEVDIPADKLAKLKTQADIINANRDEMTKAKGQKIEKAFDAIVKILDDLGLPKLPPSKVITKQTRGSGGEQMGTHVKVEPLSLNPGGLSGSQPTVDSDMGKALKKLYPGLWVAGHLLNHKMHGPGFERWNLTPLTQKTNSKMKTVTENPSKKVLLGDGVVLSYDVVVNYKAPLNSGGSNYPEGQYASSLDLTVKEMEEKNGSWSVKATQPAWATGASKNIPQDTSSLGAAVAPPIVDFNTASSAAMSTLEYVGPSRAAAIFSYRNANSVTFTSVQDFKKIPGIAGGIVDLIETNNTGRYKF
ncbi:MAG: DUF4157 domain-containing protein, partial [Flavobacteriaceae bacterium]|nr:DUF4157 domain-containing protein [Flavobacteriaceae bacterium]